MRTAFTELLGVPHPIVGFNRSPGVVAEVTKAGGFGVLAASAYTPGELDAQLTWIEKQVGGRPYGVDLLVPEKFAAGDPDNLVASLRAQIPAGAPRLRPRPAREVRHPRGARQAGRTTRSPPASARRGAMALLDVAFGHRIALIANALGTPPAGLVARAKQAGVAVAALVGQAKHARRQIDAGVDVLIAQGTEAGGHTGTIATMVLTPEIVDIAGGGRCSPPAASRPAGRWPRRSRSARPASGAARSGCAARRTSPTRRSRPSSSPRAARTRSARRPAPASPPGSCAPPGTRSGRGRAAPRRCPCRCSRCSSTRHGSGSTPPPRRATRGRCASSRSSSARSSARSTRSGRPPRSPAQMAAECEQRIAELGGLL